MTDDDDEEDEEEEQEEEEEEETSAVVERVHEAERSVAEALAPVQIAISILVAVGVLVGSRSTGLGAVLSLLAFLEHALSLGWVRVAGTALVVGTTVLNAGRIERPRSVGVRAFLFGYPVWLLTSGAVIGGILSALAGAAGAVLIPGAPTWIGAVVAFLIYPFGGFGLFRAVRRASFSVAVTIGAFVGAYVLGLPSNSPIGDAFFTGAVWAAVGGCAAIAFSLGARTGLTNAEETSSTDSPSATDIESQQDQRLPDYLARLPVFPSMEAFYSSRGGGPSPEHDLGSWWYAEHNYGQWRVTWVKDTGDLYAFHFPHGPVVLLAQIPASDFNWPDNARHPAVLPDWADHCYVDHGLLWVVQQTARWAP